MLLSSVLESVLPENITEGYVLFAKRIIHQQEIVSGKDGLRMRLTEVRCIIISMTYYMYVMACAYK